MDWINLAQDTNQWQTLMNKVLSLQVPWNTGWFLSSCTTSSFWSRTQLHGVSWLVIHWLMDGDCQLHCIKLLKHNILATLNFHMLPQSFVPSVTACLRIPFHADCVGMCMVYFHTIVHMCSSDGALIMTIKTKAKEKFTWLPCFAFYKTVNLTN
jgi:hypothetical protein